MISMMSPFGGLAWLLVLALVIAGGVALVVTMTNATNRPPARPAEEELLRMRYARGEIDTEEYRTRLAALRSPTGTGS
jgi:putative membrane protein